MQGVSDMIKRHEGFKNKIYKDTEGVLTVGWGHALQAGTEIPGPALELIFNADMDRVQMQYADLAEEYGLHLDPVRCAVLQDMLFNLGPSGVRKFKEMLKYLKADMFHPAADEMLKSAWAQQVGKRSIELAWMMRNGKWPEDWQKAW